MCSQLRKVSFGKKRQKFSYLCSLPNVIIQKIYFILPPPPRQDMKFHIFFNDTFPLSQNVFQCKNKCKIQNITNTCWPFSTILIFKSFQKLIFIIPCIKGGGLQPWQLWNQMQLPQSLVNSLLDTRLKDFSSLKVSTTILKFSACHHILSSLP